jgi:hypothetical protein
LLVTPKVASKVLAISENAVYRLVATKQLLSVKSGIGGELPVNDGPVRVVVPACDACV